VIFEKIFAFKKNSMAFGVKLPPYFDFAHYAMMAKVLLDFPIDFITCTNSVGNALMLDSETHRPVVKPNNGFAGLAGAAIKPIALANVRKFYELVGDKIQIVGCGGISNGIDAYEFALCGASAVQIATVHDTQ
jgi:dihydroorotate dehydrogenase (fumarate)